MKKIYSFLAVAAMAVGIQAQTVVLTEDFAAYSLGGNTASSGTGAPDSKDVYVEGTNVSTFPVGTKVYQAGGMAKLGTGSLVGSMTTGELNLSTDGGNVRVSFDVKGWTNVEGPIKVSVDGDSKEVTYTATMSGTPQAVSVEFSGVGTATSKVTIETIAKRAYIDNVKIETFNSTLAVSDAFNTKANLIKFTNVQDQLVFAAASDVKIVNAAGQIVKSAKVDANTELNVSSLAKGVYIVSGLVNGTAVSQKFIKK